MWMGPRFLVQHDAEVLRQPQQDGGEAEADHIQHSIEQTSQSHCSGKNQQQQRQQPEQRTPSPVREVKQQRDDSKRAGGRSGHVLLHAAGDFRDKGRPAGITDFDGGALSRVERGGDDRLHFAQPGNARTVAGQVASGFHEHDTVGAVSGGKEFASEVERGNTRPHGLRQAREIERVVSAEREGVRREPRRQLFARVGERRGDGGVGESVREFCEELGRLIKPEEGGEFSGLAGMFEPRQLPVGADGQVRRASQCDGDGAGGGFGLFGFGGPDSDDQFARVGEVFLVELESLHRRRARREQVQHLGIEAQTPQTKRDRQREEKPGPMTG